MESPKFAFTELPVELIREIASHLPDQDVMLLRLTCRAVERAVFDHFVRRFFTTKQFRMLNRRSRQLLVDISEHPVYSKALQHVILATETSTLCNVIESHDVCERPDSDNDSGSLGDNDNGGSDCSTDGSYVGPSACSLYRPLSDSVASGLDLSWLARILCNLPHIKTIQLRDFDGPKHRIAVTETETPDRPWSAWYAEWILPAEDFNNHIFTMTISALARSNARPTSLQVIYNKRAHCLSDEAFVIPPSALQAKITDLLFCLTKLELCLYKASGDGDRKASGVQNLLKFLSLATNIVDLRSRWNTDERNFDTYHLLVWLGRYSGSETAYRHSPVDMKSMCLVPSADVPPPVDFPRLERLHLDNFAVPADTVTNIVSKFRHTLRALTFRRVELVDLSNNSAHQVGIWGPCLKSIARQTNLHEWSIGHYAGVCYPRAWVPYGHFGDFPCRQVQFSGRTNGIAYSGDDASPKLAAAADDVTVLWHGPSGV